MTNQPTKQARYKKAGLSVDLQSVREISIAPGELGTLETLRLMAGLVRESAAQPDFITYARMFRTTHEVNRVHYGQFHYVHEDVETLYSPMFNLAHLTKYGKLIGDCDDISMFYGAIFYVNRIPTRFVAMKTRKHDLEFSHVVVEGFENEQWKRYDATVQPGITQIEFGRMIEYV